MTYEEERNRWGISRAIARRSQTRATGVMGGHNYRDPYWRELDPDSLVFQAQAEMLALDAGMTASTSACADLAAWASQADLPRKARRALSQLPALELGPGARAPWAREAAASLLQYQAARRRAA